MESVRATRAVRPAAGLLVLAALAGLGLRPEPLLAQEGGRDEADRDVVALLRIHEELIRAHVENLPDLWTSLETDEYVSVNGGSVSFPSPVERRDGRRAYLQAARFTRYEDVREPLVRISTDGTLGWLIAEVAVAGTLPAADGSLEAFDEVWAWIELYERTPDGWKLVGNASNRRPGDDAAGER